MIIPEEKVEAAVKYISSRTKIRPDIGIVLGTGLGDLTSKVEQSAVFNYSDIPNFPVPTVEGHSGMLVVGKIKEKNVIVQRGRIHFYEGYKLEQILFPIYLMKQMGTTILIITNCAGGINPNFSAGDLMCIADHINFMGVNPLVGKNEENIGPRFPDMSNAYDQELRKKAAQAARSLDLELKEGVYIAVTGPSFETAAEIRAFWKLGADAIGMSTVPEVIFANYLGLKVLGISCITNILQAPERKPLTHKEVTRVAQREKDKIARLLTRIVELI